MRYLITGGTGSFGSRYTERLLKRGDSVVVFSRDELKQYEMRKRLPDAEYVIGDVRDRYSLASAIRGVDIVVHAAALKHVHTGETHPSETVRTNVVGTQNVIDAVVNSNATRAVLLSTDKAVMPVNLYGSSKYTAEKLWLRANHRAAKFTATRYGNVIGSRGSVLHVFWRQKRDGVFTITDRRMTRFVVSFDDAIRMVDLAAGKAPAGHMVIGRFPACRIVDIAEAFDPAARFREIGVGAGEKIHEMMMSSQEMARASEWEDVYLLPPDIGGYRDDAEPYTSDGGPFLTVAELRGVIDATV